MDTDYIHTECTDGGAPHYTNKREYRRECFMVMYNIGRNYEFIHYPFGDK